MFSNIYKIKALCFNIDGGGKYPLHYKKVENGNKRDIFLVIKLNKILH